MRYLKYKGVVFDLDYTLYDEHKYFFSVFEDFCDKTKYNGKLKQMERSFLFLRQRSKDILGDILSVNEFEQDKLKLLKDELFRIYISINVNIKPYEDAILLLNSQKTKDLKLGILTNGVIEAQRNKIKCLSLTDYFDEIFFARQLGKGLEKPNRGAFEEIAERLKIPAPELIFIGDNPNTDFKGAKEIGGFTVRLKRGVYSNVPINEFVDVEIEDLSKIERIL